MADNRITEQSCQTADSIIATRLQGIFTTQNRTLLATFPTPATVKQLIQASLNETKLLRKLLPIAELAETLRHVGNVAAESNGQENTVTPATE